MMHQLRLYAVPEEDPGLFLSIHLVPENHQWLHFQEIQVFFLASVGPGICMVHSYMYVNTHIHLKKNKSSLMYKKFSLRSL